MKYRIDAMSLRDGTLMLEGWAMPAKAAKISYQVTDQNGKPMKFTCVARDRADVAQQFGADRMCGFTAAIPFERGQELYFILQDGNVQRKIRINEKKVLQKNSIKAKRAEKLLAFCHVETLVVCWDFFKENGFAALWKKVIHKLQKIDEDYDYPEWELKTKRSEEELEKEREAWKQFSFAGGHAPLISIVIPAFKTPEKYLELLFDSFLAQTYPNFEVILADGSGDGYDAVRKVTENYAAKDARFHYVGLGKNLGISENTNAGLRAANGAYIALCDHDDELPPYALYEVAKAISQHPDAQFLYTDEDKIDFDGKALFEPHFKSDYNEELLTSVNYICHLSVIRRDLLDAVGGFREAYDGAQDYDFFLRCCETATAAEQKKLALYEEAVREIGMEQAKADPEMLRVLSQKCGFSEAAVKELLEGRFTSEHVIHIPVICYHWRYHKGSTAQDPKAKLYAFEAGKRAIAAHYERCGIAAGRVENGVTYGYYRTYFTNEDGSIIRELLGKDGKPPKVSVLIPNKDHIEDLDKCVRSLVRLSHYRNLEIIVIENNSTDPKTFAYYDAIEGNPGYYLQKEDEASVDELSVSDIKLHVVRWPREFNYSAINNFGAKAATGDYFLFLNNDVELIGPDSITEMVAYASRKMVGAVGARLMYGDDTIQHAGVIVGLGGIAGACFVGLHEKENSYMHRMMCTQDYSAVTAACLMTPRAVFEEAGGFYEDLAVAFNDIDYCMKVRKLGRTCVYDPYVTFHHYESKSRGLEDTPEKVMRFNGEIATFASRWGAILEKGDPYYNPNLTLRKANFALRDLTKEKPGEPYHLELDIEKQLKVVLQEKERREKLHKS